MKIWNLVTHGVVPETSLSWNYGGFSYDHRSFAPVNGVVVFDEKVRKKNMETLKLVFLTGIMISNETMSDIKDLVNDNGLLVITTPELAPSDIKNGYSGGTKVIPAGKNQGKWIITDNVLSDMVRNELKGYLGKDDEIRYVIGNDEFIFKFNGDENIKVTLDNKELYSGGNN